MRSSPLCLCIITRGGQDPGTTRPLAKLRQRSRFDPRREVHDASPPPLLLLLLLLLPLRLAARRHRQPSCATLVRLVTASLRGMCRWGGQRCGEPLHDRWVQQQRGSAQRGGVQAADAERAGQSFAARGCCCCCRRR